jgi:ABC-type Fe3+-hydroxamate transport system substrate-binding protein
MLLQLPHRLYNQPLRIVSLVPSLTELLYHLGLEAETVGITKFCIHPSQWFATKARVGGTKTVNIRAVEALHPTLIIANKEENIKEQVETLAKKFPVWLTDVNTLEDAIGMIADIGQLTGKIAEATTLAGEINTRFNHLPNHCTHKTAYLIWRKPYMAAGSDTFIHDMLTRCGFSNVLGHYTRYPEVTPEQLFATGCELLLLSSEPYPFKQAHIAELSKALPNIKILLVNGELFSWYGSRLLLSPGYFLQLIEQAKN